MSRKGWVGLSVDYPRATSLATGLVSRGFGVKDTRVRGINTSGCPRNVSRTNLKIGFFMIVLIFLGRFYDPHLLGILHIGQKSWKSCQNQSKSVEIIRNHHQKHYLHVQVVWEMRLQAECGQQYASRGRKRLPTASIPRSAPKFYNRHRKCLICHLRLDLRLSCQKYRMVEMNIFKKHVWGDMWNRLRMT